MPDRIKQDISDALGGVRSHLEYLRDLGLDDLPRSVAQGALPICPVDRQPGVDPGVSCRLETLEEVRADLGDCQRCALGKTRTRLVYGVGDPSTRLVLVGEAPGREEDERGEPFVGEAGRLLDRILAAMGLSREQVYICNVLKCRPPQNRDPLPEEVETCEPFLLRQLSAIRPQVIITLGRFAAQSLLRDKSPISRLRGQWQTYHGIPLMPTYHPAYLLRSPAGKREVWEDMKQVMLRLRQLEKG